MADLIRREDVALATLARKITDPLAVQNPNVVKVVFDHQGGALYFSRHAIPYVRGAETAQWFEKTDYYQHIGIYGYKADTLRRVASLPPGRLEQAESLEQLRWLEDGLRIQVAVSDLAQNISIDTPDDLVNIPKEYLV